MQRSVYSYRAGYTLIEILVATALSLILLGAVVQIFALIGGSVNDSRATLEASDRLRATAVRLQKDLAGLTVTPIPPRSPESDEGYLEIIEGPVGPVIPIAAPGAIAVDNDNSGAFDTTVGDFDDILMFTTRSTDRPFVGKCASATSGTIESDTAEIAWFVRGRTLYRRVLLVVPGAIPTGTPVFAHNDISVRLVGANVVSNTLGDLTRHESRFAHPVSPQYPCHPHFSHSWPTPTPTPTPTKWATVGLTGNIGLGLPTLRECSSGAWPAGNLPSLTLSDVTTIDFWNNPHPWPEVDPITGTLALYPSNLRIAEDVILTNVIGFDVKVWDPVARAYVNLNYHPNPSISPFAGPGNPNSGLVRVYDTWSTHYESDGVDQNGGGVDEGTNGFDDDTAGPGYGIVDDAGERETSPPYPVPLRGIQVKIRVFEPDSRQIREVTVVQDFLPK